MGLLGWTRADVPALTGRTALVTGANSGIGFELCRQLVEHGCEVIMVGRDEQLVKWAARDLEEEFPGCRVHPKACNLENPKQVEALARDIDTSKTDIDILVCCAGRYLDAPFATTPDGIEQTLASNYWGHAELTLLLLDRLAPGARVVNVSSPAEMYGTVDLGDIKGARLGTSGMPAYARSKAMQIMWNHELQRRLRLAGRDVDCFAVHPGIVATGLANKVDRGRYAAGLATYAMMVLQGQSPVQGAQSALYAATAPGLHGTGGRYIGPQNSTNLFHASERWARNPSVYDTDARARLFDATVDTLGAALGRRVPSLPAVGRPITLAA